MVEEYNAVTDNQSNELNSVPLIAIAVALDPAADTSHPFHEPFINWRLETLPQTTTQPESKSRKKKKAGAGIIN